MKFFINLIVIIALALYPKSIVEAVTVVVGQPATVVSASYLLTENFENVSSPGYDSGTWTETGTPNENTSTSGLSLQASECLLVSASANTQNTTSPTFTANSTIYGYFQIRFSALPTGGTWTCFQFRHSAGECTRLRVTAGGAFAVRAGAGTEVTTSGVMATNTTYHVFTSYVAGTGTNAIVTVGFSTDGTRPTSGSNFATQTTGGTATASADRIMIGQSSSNTVSAYFDRVLVDDVQISNNP